VFHGLGLGERAGSRASTGTSSRSPRPIEERWCPSARTWSGRSRPCTPPVSGSGEARITSIDARDGRGGGRPTMGSSELGERTRRPAVTYCQAERLSAACAEVWRKRVERGFWQYFARQGLPLSLYLYPSFSHPLTLSPSLPSSQESTTWHISC